MASPEGSKLSQMIQQGVTNLKKLCGSLDEKTASRAPEGRWSPKQILSHVWGPESGGFYPTFAAFIEQDTPRLDIEAENPFFSEKRARMTFAELLSQVEREYDRIARFAEGLSEEQLGRKAHIPLLKETPIGEYPTLAQWIGAIGGYHMKFHIDHMKEILQGLGVKVTP